MGSNLRRIYVGLMMEPFDANSHVYGSLESFHPSHDAMWYHMAHAVLKNILKRCSKDLRYDTT
jgi:hypothetical protein